MMFTPDFNKSNESEAARSAMDLLAQLNYRPEKFNHQVLFREDGFQLILFALQTGQEITPHKTKHNAYLQCLEGLTIVTIGSTTHQLQKGEILLLPKEIMHGIVALANTKLLLLKQS